MDIANKYRSLNTDRSPNQILNDTHTNVLSPYTATAHTIFCTTIYTHIQRCTHMPSYTQI